MRKIRVLVVDDAVVVRRMLARVLEEDPSLEVAGLAANGQIALSRIPQVNPDVVVLDVEMPVMDGLQTLREIRRKHPRLAVLMFSALTERGAAATLDALALGAADYAAKPSNFGGDGRGTAAIRESLIPKIRIFGARAAGLASEALPKVQPMRRFPPRGSAGSPIDVVAIGVSTGGPNALDELLPQFAADFPVPVVIVQHMPPIFTKLMAARLSSRSRIRVEEGFPGVELRPGWAWVAPGNYHLALRRDGAAVRLETNQDPPENSCRPAVDVLFRFVAQVYGPRSLGVVMTGMGQDGLRGSEFIREAGGQILAQDEATSVIWGMPGYVARAGLADRVLPLHQLGQEIIRRVVDSRNSESCALLAGNAGGN